MDNRRNTVSFRIRKIDTDLAEAIANLGKDELAEAARNGLRIMLGLTSTRSAQVVEKPIIVPQKAEQTKAITIQSTSAAKIYKPKS